VLIITLFILGYYATHNHQNQAYTVSSMTFESGRFSFDGTLLNGAFHGYGHITFADGATFTGMFEHGRFHGDGIFTSANYEQGGWQFSGVFEQGRAVDGNFYIEGQSVSFDVKTLSLPQIIILDNKYIITGTFINGLAHGPGSLTTLDGVMIYAGEFYEGLFHGMGTYYSVEGWIYEGSFYKGMMHGFGVLTHNHVIYRGVWNQGKMVTRYE